MYICTKFKEIPSRHSRDIKFAGMEQMDGQMDGQPVNIMPKPWSCQHGSIKKYTYGKWGKKATDSIRYSNLVVHHSHKLVFMHCLRAFSGSFSSWFSCSFYLLLVWFLFGCSCCKSFLVLIFIKSTSFTRWHQHFTQDSFFLHSFTYITCVLRELRVQDGQSVGADVPPNYLLYFSYRAETYKQQWLCYCTYIIREKKHTPFKSALFLPFFSSIFGVCQKWFIPISVDFEVKCQLYQYSHRLLPVVTMGLVLFSLVRLCVFVFCLFVCVCVVLAKMVLEKPTVEGTTTEVVLSTLAGVFTVSLSRGFVTTIVSQPWKFIGVWSRMKADFRDGCGPSKSVGSGGLGVSIISIHCKTLCKTKEGRKVVMVTSLTYTLYIMLTYSVYSFSF